MFQSIEESIGGISIIPIEKKAIFIKDTMDNCELLPGQKLYQALYKMEPSYEGNDYIIISASDTTKSPFDKVYETYLFSADSSGEIIDWTELRGSQSGVYSHEKVLTDIGYRLIR